MSVHVAIVPVKVLERWIMSTISNLFEKVTQNIYIHIYSMQWVEGFFSEKSVRKNENKLIALKR